MCSELHLQNMNSITRQVAVAEKLPLYHGELVQLEVTALQIHSFTVS
jgi:hypothetical protein